MEHYESLTIGISIAVGAYTDVRQDIASMKESLAAIEAHLGLKG
ncbi:MAG: hypothetical protein WC455_17835 [Dehalococcoidia bacterium]|jgi:hypothetical protein